MYMFQTVCFAFIRLHGPLAEWDKHTRIPEKKHGIKTMNKNLNAAIKPPVGHPKVGGNMEGFLMKFHPQASEWLLPFGKNTNIRFVILHGK